MGVVCQQLKKEGRRNAYELHKIQALHQRQKMVSHQHVESSMCFSVILVELYLIK
jgi:kinesin family protein 4/21/27